MPARTHAICVWTRRKADDWRRFGRSNPVIRTVIVHWIIGAGTGVFCAGLLLALDPLGFRSLLFRSDALVPGLALLFGGFATTFGGLVSAAAVMFPDFEEKTGAGSGRRARLRAFGVRTQAATNESDRRATTRRSLSALS